MMLAAVRSQKHLASILQVTYLGAVRPEHRNKTTEQSGCSKAYKITVWD